MMLLTHLRRVNRSRRDCIEPVRQRGCEREGAPESARFGSTVPADAPHVSGRSRRTPEAKVLHVHRPWGLPADSFLRISVGRDTSLTRREKRGVRSEID